MEKSNYPTSNYGISKNENMVLSALESLNLPVFSSKDVIRILSWKKQKAQNILHQLKKKGLITSMQKGIYAVVSETEENLFSAATKAISPGYISFWTALSHYGFTEQQPLVIQVATPKRHREISIGKYKAVPIILNQRRFFGYRKESNFNMAEKEKCLIDSFAYPEKAGGFQEVLKCLKNAYPSLDKRAFVSYLNKLYVGGSLNKLGTLL